MSQTTTLHTIFGVSKAKTDKAILVEIEDNGAKVQSWIPLSVAAVRFIGRNFEVQISVPGWFFRKISWKTPAPYVPKAKAAPAPKVAAAPVSNSYAGNDYGNLMEEKMILEEILASTENRFERERIEESIKSIDRAVGLGV